LRNSRLKKFLPWILWERRTLASATLLQAMSEQEADAFLPLGLSNPVSIQPVGLEIAQVQPRPPRPTGPRTCLFLSRIHPKKGLPMLVRAWARVRPPNWQLLIIGPDDNGHSGEVERLVASLGLGDGVVLRGPAYGAEKWNLLATADLFILPSYSENFGIVVAEAMAAGLPVITTTGTPWNMLQEKRVGWWVEPTEAAVATALGDATNRPAAELVAMGEKAALIARQDFTWEQITRSLHAAYSWASAGGEKPPCVRIP
jgi:glycosyltransferase involved in cell wall biosynthesis